MSMLNVSKYMVEDASYALLKQRTKWGLNCSILLMVLCTSMVLMVKCGYAARNARKYTILLVSAQINHNQQNGPLYAAFLNVNSKRVRIDLPKWVIFKQVTILIAVAKQKKGKPQPPKVERQGKDGRKIGIRRESSSRKNRKEQEWSEEDINTCFDLWEANPTKKPEERLSKHQISLQTGVPYTTVCERLSGRSAGGKRGKIAGGKRQGKVLDAGKSKQVIKWVTITIFN